MSVCLCTLILNEAEWIEKLYRQWRPFPDLAKWYFVESADRIYAEANPSLVTQRGLSVDGTTEFLEKMAKEDDRVVHIKHGISVHRDPAQGKCESRQRYLFEMEKVKPDFFLIVDADEFMSFDDQRRILAAFWAAPAGVTAFCFRYRNIWRPPSIADQPLFAHEVVGGFWAIPHCHGWRWMPGLKYNGYHMTPEKDGQPLSRNMKHFRRSGDGGPQCVHMAFASDIKGRVAKHKYYRARGEERDRVRAWYVESRGAFEDWRPGTALPRGANVVPYDGPVPEVFQEATPDAQAG